MGDVELSYQIKHSKIAGAGFEYSVILLPENFSNDQHQWIYFFELPPKVTVIVRSKCDIICTVIFWTAKRET